MAAFSAVRVLEKEGAFRACCALATFSVLNLQRVQNISLITLEALGLGQPGVG